MISHKIHHEHSDKGTKRSKHYSQKKGVINIDDGELMEEAEKAVRNELGMGAAYAPDPDDLSESGTLDSCVDTEESKKAHWIAIIFMSSTAVLWFGSGFVYGLYFRKWNFVQTLYFIFVTLTTVGYGDLGFMTDGIHDDFTHHVSDRVFGIFFVLLGVEEKFANKIFGYSARCEF